MSAGSYCGGNKGKGKPGRAQVVARVMKEHHLNLAQASKYGKEHALYKRGGLLSMANLDDMKGATSARSRTARAGCSVCRRDQLIREIN
jgi:hypothetical protein